MLPNDRLSDESLPSGPLDFGPVVFDVGRFLPDLTYERWLAAIFWDPPTVVTSEVPEPSSLALLCGGLLSWGAYRVGRQKRTS